MNIEEILKTAPKPHIPDKFPINLKEILSDNEILTLLFTANRKIGMYDGFLYNTPNPSLLISPLITQEASLSSKLEGTHATIEDILNYDAGAKVEIEEDEMKEVINYRRALFFAIDKMGRFEDDEKGKLPLSTRLIKEVHKILLSNVRGSKKSPGEFKRNQNYIGYKNSIEFTPLPPNMTDEYMNNLENYIHDDSIDPLLQAALIHVQFEMIHPFQDGNGRIGRLLIPLFLYYRSVLLLPTFYMSKYFEKDRNLYLQNLSNVSKNNEYKSWIKYFLQGVIEQSEENTIKAKNLLDEYEKIKSISFKNINSQYLPGIIDFMFQYPAFNINQLIDKVGMAKDTAYKITRQMINLKILSSNEASRNRIFYTNSIFKHLIND